MPPGWQAVAVWQRCGQRADAISIVVTADVVAETILVMIDEVKEWQGTASELLDKLNSRVSDQIKRSDQWPKAPNKLSNRLRRAAPGLRAMALEVVEHDQARPRRWELRIRVQNTDSTVRTVKSVDTVDDVDSLRPHSYSDQGLDIDQEETIAAAVERDENPESGVEQGAGPWRERI